MVHFFQMAIIFNDAGLKDIEPPCVAMTFINHNAQMHKIFIIGHDFLLVKRPSIKNFVSAGLSGKNNFFTFLLLQCSESLGS